MINIKARKKKNDDDEEESHDDDEENADEDGEKQEDDDYTKNQKTEKLRAKKELQKIRAKQKVGKIGYYMRPKAMNYEKDADALIPEKDRGGPKHLIDLSVIRKGTGAVNELTQHQRGSDFRKEEAFLEAEEDRLTKAAREAERVKKLEEDKKLVEKEKQQEAKKKAMEGDKKKEDEPAGRIRVTEAQNLPNNIDDVIKRLQEIDFSVQELDVLIELSKTLKAKRANLFPETQFMFTLGKETGLTQEEFERAEQQGDD